MIKRVFVFLGKLSHGFPMSTVVTCFISVVFGLIAIGFLNSTKDPEFDPLSSNVIEVTLPIKVNESFSKFSFLLNNHGMTEYSQKHKCRINEDIYYSSDPVTIKAPGYLQQQNDYFIFERVDSETIKLINLDRQLHDDLKTTIPMQTFSRDMGDILIKMLSACTAQAESEKPIRDTWD